MRPHYSDYAKHITRQFIALKDTNEDLDDVTRNNVDVVRRVFISLSSVEQDIVYRVYSYRVNEMSLGVAEVARETGMMPESIRSIMRVYERKLAEERGLIPCRGRENAVELHQGDAVRL